MPDIGIVEQIVAVQREITLRLKHYPRWVRLQKMTQDLADLEVARMRAVLETLRAVERGRVELPPDSSGGAEAVRLSERAMVMRVVGRHVHSSAYLRIEAAITREVLKPTIETDHG